MPKSVLTAGVAVIGAGAVAIAPTVRPSEYPAPEIRIAAAATSPSTGPFAVTPSGTSAPADLSAVLVHEPAPDSAGNTIKDIYDAVEPWVAYGVELAVYAFGWASFIPIPDIPGLGYAFAFSDQIYIFYDTGEIVVQSVVYNFADLIDGVGDLWQNLGDIAASTVEAFWFFLAAEAAYWLPPLPPLPPLFGVTSVEAPQEPLALDAAQAVPDKTLATEPAAAETTLPEATPNTAEEKMPGALARTEPETPAETTEQTVPEAATTDGTTAAVETEPEPPAAPDAAERQARVTTRSASAAPGTKTRATVNARGAVSEAAEDVAKEVSSSSPGASRESLSETPMRASDGLAAGAGDPADGARGADGDVGSAPDGHPDSDSARSP